MADLYDDLYGDITGGTSIAAMVSVRVRVLASGVSCTGEGESPVRAVTCSQVLLAG